MISMQSVIVVLVLCAVLPFAVYVTVKLGTVAFFRGRQVFHDSEFEIRRKQNGDENAKEKT